MIISNSFPLYNHNIKSNNNSKYKNKPFLQQSNNSISFKASDYSYLELIGRDLETSFINVQFSVENGQKYNLKLDKDFIHKYLSNGTSSINKTHLKQLVSIYSEIFNKVIKEDEETTQKLKENATETSKKSKIISFDNQNVNGLNGKSPLEKLLTSIRQEKTKKEIATFILNNFDNSIETQSQYALSIAHIILDISKNNDGSFDTSNLDIKYEVAKKINELSYQYQSPIFEEQIIEVSKNENCSFDISFADALCDFLKLSDGINETNSISNRAQILRKFILKDEQQAHLITKAICEFQTHYYLDDETDNFEVAFNQSFNPQTGKFDKKAFECLKYFAKESNDFLSEMPCETEEDYQALESKQRELVKAYFAEIRDNETGEIKENYILPSEFFENL